MSPSPRIPEASLEGISASSPSDIWAVGRRSRQGRVLIEHWAGSRWRIIRTPAVTSTPGWAVAALSVSSAWAVGGDADTRRPVRLRWDGRHWSAVPTRMFASDVAAAGADRAWAVGGRPRIEHWGGKRWSAVPAPEAVPRRLDYELAGVAAVGSVEAWAVGRASDDRAEAFAVTFASRWDGRRWRYVPTPNVSVAERAENAFFAADGASPMDVWAVGFWESPDQDRGGALIEHWKGHRWQVVPSAPGPPCDSRMGTCLGSDSLYGVAAIAGDDAWAVGERPKPVIENGELVDYASRPLVEHWDGRRWRVVPIPGDGRLTDVVALSKANVWAIGEDRGDGSTPFILHYGCG